MDRRFVSAKRGQGYLFAKVRRSTRHQCSNRLLAPRDQRGSADCFLGLQNAPTSFRAAAVSPILLWYPFFTIGRQMRAAGGDALTPPNHHYGAELFPQEKTGKARQRKTKLIQREREGQEARASLLTPGQHIQCTREICALAAPMYLPLD
jgi:hypothetical protein